MWQFLECLRINPKSKHFVAICTRISAIILLETSQSVHSRVQSNVHSICMYTVRLLGTKLRKCQQMNHPIVFTGLLGLPWADENLVEWIIENFNFD